jgi:transposase-like protein
MSEKERKLLMYCEKCEQYYYEDSKVWYNTNSRYKCRLCGAEEHNVECMGTGPTKAQEIKK